MVLTLLAAMIEWLRVEAAGGTLKASHQPLREEWLSQERDGNDGGQLPQRQPALHPQSPGIEMVRLRWVTSHLVFAELALHCVALWCVVVRCVVLRCVALRCVKLCCNELGGLGCAGLG